MTPHAALRGNRFRDLAQSGVDFRYRMEIGVVAYAFSRGEATVDYGV